MPGASASGGCAALPVAGGLPFFPERAASQAVQSVHQLPSWRVAPLCHSAAVGGGGSASLVQ